MRLEKPKRLIIWNGQSSSLLKSTKTIEQGTAHVRDTNFQFNAKQYEIMNQKGTNKLFHKSMTNLN